MKRDFLDGCRNGSTQSSSLAGMSKARSNSNESDLVGGVAPLNSERHCSSSDSLNNDTNQVVFIKIKVVSDV